MNLYLELDIKLLVVLLLVLDRTLMRFSHLKLVDQQEKLLLRPDQMEKQKLQPEISSRSVTGNGTG